MDAQRELRGIVVRRDADALLELLTGPTWPPDSLQLIGDGLLDALRDRPDAEPAALRCVAALRERDWEGDDILADALQAKLDGAPCAQLRPLTVDLDELAEGLGQDPSIQGRIELATGEFQPGMDPLWGNDDEGNDEDEDGWLWVDGLGSRPGYRDLEAFVAQLEDGRTAELLSVAIQGSGAFRRFRSTLDRWPDLGYRWVAFRDDRGRGRARAWLAGEGYTPVRC